MKEKHFDDSWKIWIWSNVGRGCDKQGIFKILYDKGFDYDAIKQELNYEPSVNLDEIENPLTDAAPGKNRFFVANSRKVASDRVELYTLDDFLNEEECSHLIDLMQTKLRPSTVTNPDVAGKDFRTSSTFDFGNSGDPIAAAIDIRICRTLGINPSFAEEIQGQFYGPGEEFKAHTDYFTPGTDEFAEHAGNRGQRSWTFMIYLNDVEEGGETSFVEIDETIKPKAGKAVFWNSLYPDGHPNPDTLHHAMPVIKGNKSIITKWFRVNGYGDINIKTDAEFLPNFTNLGFKKEKVPDDIFQELRTFLDENLEHEEKEYQSLDYLPNDTGVHPTGMIELPVELKEKTAAALKPMVEEWGDTELAPTSVYGIRRYHEGTRLLAHRDTTNTHILSAIVNIEQDVEEEWPLEIEDNVYRSHEVYLQPGEMLLYESARLLHGRRTPLKGKSYSNVFIHFMPSTDDWETTQ